MDGEGSERFDTVVVGAGQAGLSAGYHLKQAGSPFVILDANDRIGDSWRKRYDSLRLFTPSWADRAAGLALPEEDRPSPTRDQMADYLEAYAERFDLPVRTGVDVERISRVGRPVRPVSRRRSDRGRPRDRRLGSRPGPAGPRVLPRARPGDRADALERRTATRRSSATGGVLVVGRRQLGRRHLARRRRLAPDVALRAGSRARAGRASTAWVARNVAFRMIRFVGRPRPDAPDADRTQGEGEGGIQGRHAGPRQAEAARGRRYRTRPEDRRRQRRPSRCSRTAACSTSRT